MKKLPDKKELDIIWTSATSSAIETGTRPHLIFARLLYYELSDEGFPVKLAD
jgi:methylthioribose-1-phosphate isomerase